MSDWTEAAACKGYPLQWFFPPSGEHPPAEAFRLCAKCDVRDECAREGDRSRDIGLWGGTFRNEKKSRQFRPEVRCVKCRRLFTRAAGTADLVCDSCLSLVELRRRRARDVKRNQRARKRNLEAEVSAFEAAVDACEREWEQVESGAISGGRDAQTSALPPDTWMRGIEMAHSSEAT